MSYPDFPNYSVNLVAARIASMLPPVGGEQILTQAGLIYALMKEPIQPERDGNDEPKREDRE